MILRTRGISTLIAKNIQLNDITRLYTDLLASKAEIPTKMITSGIVATIGDTVLQLAESKSSGFDWRRLLVFDLVAIFYIAPITHYWFLLLDSLPLFPSNKLLRATTMVCIDQCIGAIFITAGFFIFFEFMNRCVLNLQQRHFETSLLTSVSQSCRYNLWPTLLANWCYWPIANFFNFLVIPVKYRLLTLTI